MKVKSSFISILSLLVLTCFSQPASAQQPEPDSYLVVKNPHQSGFFATFASVLGALNMYDQGSYAGIKVTLDSQIYRDPKKGPNWWNYFFKPITLGDPTKEPYTFTFDDTHHLITTGLNLTRTRAKELIDRYIHIKPEIEHEVNEFIAQNFSHCFVIGLHYRGTDKIAEAPRVSYEKAISDINWIIGLLHLEGANFKIFVASDEQEFVDFINRCYPGRIINTNFIRSTNNIALHSGMYYQSNFQKGKEALLDCLLLSRCGFLIRTESCLSKISEYFNPHLQVHILRP